MSSTVGLSTLNGFVHNLTGTNETLYTITDILGWFPVAVAAGFGLLGLLQWIKRKDLRKVDSDILFLGGFYTVVLAAYFFFEVVVINYRPILIEEVLEASYPSSHTMLALCILTTAIVQFRMRIRQKTVRRCVLITTSVLALAIVIGRTLCGAHWLSDIIGGCLLSTCLIEAYLFCISINIKQKHL